MWFVGRLPLGTAKAMGAAVGLLGWVVVRAERRKTLKNIAIAFPSATDEERARLGRRCFMSLGRRAAEVCWIEGLEIERYVQIPSEDRELIDQALAQGRGLLWITAHFGNWELLAAGLSAHGYDVRPIATQSYDPRFTEMVDKWRKRHRVRTMWRGRDDIAAGVAAALREGAVVGLLIDQDTKTQGCFVPFFGRPAWTPSGAAELMRRSGAPPLVGFIFPSPERGHVIRVVEPEVRSQGDEELIDRENTASFTEAIESAVRRQPEEWVWMHQRWRTRPKEEGHQ